MVICPQCCHSAISSTLRSSVKLSNDRKEPILTGETKLFSSVYDITVSEIILRTNYRLTKAKITGIFEFKSGVIFNAI